MSSLESLTASQVAPKVHKEHISREIQTFDTTEVRVGQNTLMSGAWTTEIELLATRTHLRIINNYSPISTTSTDTEVNNCFSIYHTS